MKCGINGAEHDFNEILCGINGAVRQASELWIGVNGAVKKVWPTFPVGSQVILDTVGSGEWTCPASGNWLLELHGGGGGGGSFDALYYRLGGGGGGSGEEYEIALNAGQNVLYEIGNGTFLDGKATTFGEYSIDGGRHAVMDFGGSGVGSLATDGTNAQYGKRGKGGSGNKNKPSQTYGNGGDGADVASDSEKGTDGAIILTYLG